MRSGRRCSRSGCGQDSVATLTYVYSDSTAVLGPLATYAEPHSYDLCESHASRLTAPRGWEVVRLTMDEQGPVGPSHDDLLALVEAVREAARPRDGAGARGAGPSGPGRGGPSRGRAGADGTDARGGAGEHGPAGQGNGGPSGRATGRRAHLRVLGPVADDPTD